MSSHDDESQVRALLRLAREVTARHDLDDVLAETFRVLRALVEFGGGSIQLIDDDGWITVAACDPPASAGAMGARVPLGNSVAGRVVLTEQAIYVADAQADGRAVPLPASTVTEEVRSYLAVPLLADGRAIGLLRIDDPRTDAFGPQDRLLICAAAVVVGSAIQNARAEARSTASRARVDVLQRRIDQARAVLAHVQTSTDDTADRGPVAGLVTALETALGDPPQLVTVPTEAPHVTS